MRWDANDDDVVSGSQNCAVLKASIDSRTESTGMTCDVIETQVIDSIGVTRVQHNRRSQGALIGVSRAGSGKKKCRYEPLCVSVLA